MFCLLADCEPIDFEEAIRYRKWEEAMNEEIKAIEMNTTWELTKLPSWEEGNWNEVGIQSKRECERRY